MVIADDQTVITIRVLRAAEKIKIQRKSLINTFHLVSLGKTRILRIVALVFVQQSKVVIERISIAVY